MVGWPRRGAAAAEQGWWRAAAEQGCISGGGEWHSDRSWVCMNYWRPNVADDRPACHLARNSTLDCLSNLTSKITGDDTEHIIDEFLTFLDKHSSTVAETAKPFLAVLWLHTIHLPRGALPQWFHNEGHRCACFLHHLHGIEREDESLRRLV